MSALAGLCAGAAAACSLLTAAVSPVLLIWMWLNNRAGNRWIKSAGFVGGALVAFVPVLALFARGPHQVIFNILKYHTLYRRVSWAGATSHDIGVATDWVNSSPTLLFVLLAVVGLFFMQKNEFFFLEKNGTGAPELAARRILAVSLAGAGHWRPEPAGASDVSDVFRVHDPISYGSGGAGILRRG